MAAQEQALRTNNIKKVVEKSDTEGNCRMCGQGEEAVAHIVSEHPKLAQKEYKNWQHDNVASVLHRELCKKFNFASSEKWYHHKVEKVLEDEDVNILWDCTFQTDEVVMEHSCPDIVILY